jgi:glycosyltransferase involved in cell wall biosynthesis
MEMSERIKNRLKGLGIDLDRSEGSFGYWLHRAGSESSEANIAPARRQMSEPLVSCLMVTRGNLQLLKYSVQCYRQQTYPNRELVVVTDAGAAPSVEGFLRQSGIPNIVLVGVAPNPPLTLGDRRNIAMARARGDIFVQWDDDDLFDPRRIAAAVATLQQTKAAAAFLVRWLVWWPQRRVAAISHRRLWEGSMAVWRDHAPVYPALTQSEDTAAVQSLANHHLIALMDVPCHYIYSVTGQNTWHVAHFEYFIEKAECLFQGAEFDELNELLSARLPVLEYAAELRRM